MATDLIQQVISHQDFQGAREIRNLPDATSASMPATKGQMDSALATKQNSLTGGDGIDITSSVVSVDLSVAGSDYTSLIVTNQAHASLNGTYTRNEVKGHADDTGNQINYTHNAGNFSWFYKDNGGGVWALAIKRSNDGVDDTAEWLVALTTTNPTTISGNVTGLIADYTAVDYDFLTYSNELDERSLKVPAADATDVAYPNGPASYLKIDDNKLAVDVVTAMGSAVTGKLADSLATKTYIDSGVASAKVAGNNTFINTTANLTGNPATVQAAIEAAAAEIDTANSNISNNSATISTHTSQIAAHSTTLGVTNGDTDLGAFTAPNLTDSSTLKTVLENLASDLNTVDDNLASQTGVAKTATDLGAMTSLIYSDSTNIKALFEEAGSAIEQLQLGMGAFWEPVVAVSDETVSPVPVGWGDGLTDVASFIIDPNGLNQRVDAFTSGDRILVIGGTAINGIYRIFDAGAGVWSALRAVDANTSDEFTTNKTVFVSGDGTGAGYTYAYDGADNPVIDTDALSFTVKSVGVIGDGSVTEDKLSSALATKVNDKTDKYVTTATTDGSGYATITHGLGTADVVVQVWSTGSPAETVPTAEISNPTTTQVTIGGAASTNYKVVVIG